MDFRLLRYFVACVEHRTMHAAAEAAFVSQPALSKAIHNLEDIVGVKLLDRRPRGVVPTPYGEVLFRYAKMIDSELRRATAEIDAMRGMTRGTVVVGVIPTMAALIGDLAIELTKSHPGLRLKLRVGFSTDLSPALRAGELDMAILLLPAGEAPPGLAFESLLDTRPTVAVRVGHPLLEQGEVTLADLGQCQWVFPEYPPTHRAIIMGAFIDAGIPPPEAVIEVSTAIFFDDMIRQSDLLTIVPSTFFDERGRGRGLASVPMQFAFPAERIGLAYREQSTLLPGAKHIREELRARCAKVAPPPGD